MKRSTAALAIAFSLGACNLSEQADNQKPSYIFAGANAGEKAGTTPASTGEVRFYSGLCAKKSELPCMEASVPRPGSMVNIIK